MPTVIATAELIKNQGRGGIDAPVLNENEAQSWAETVKRYMQAVDAHEPSTCLDGRPCLHLLSGAATNVRPGLAGGAGISGWAAAELTGWAGDVNESLAETYHRITTVLASNGLVVGGHCDDQAAAAQFKNGKTGCGASDNAAAIIANLADPQYHDFMTGLSARLLGDDFDQTIMDAIIAKARSLTENGRLASWQGATMVDDLGNQTAERIEVLASQPDATHGHHEQSVVVNFVPGTTLNRDQLVADTGRQAFKIDMWYLDDVANALATGPAAAKQKQALGHALVAYQLATYVTLCNGNHRAIIFK